jgi:hypothetical protein
MTIIELEETLKHRVAKSIFDLEFIGARPQTGLDVSEFALVEM